MLTLRVASAPAISGLECFWSVALTELDGAHIAWALPSADPAGVVTRHAMLLPLCFAGSGALACAPGPNATQFVLRCGLPALGELPEGMWRWSLC